jgi:hypothetical protein
VWEDGACVKGVLSPPAFRRGHLEYHLEGQCAEECTGCERSNETPFDRKEKRVGNRVVSHKAGKDKSQGKRLSRIEE